jgi:hypothetical protein
MSSKYLYEDRIVAFIDILGFKQKISNTYKEGNIIFQSEIDKITNAYEIIRDFLRLNETNDAIKKSLDKERKVTIFSDSIVISFPCTQTSEIFFTLHDLQLLLAQLIQYGFLCRGALVYGKIIHNERFCFGPAFNEAHKTECKAALYPRVILSEELIQKAGEAHAEHHSPQQEIGYVKDWLLTEDTDGMYFIDYFEKVKNDFDDPNEDFYIYMKKMSEIIKDGIQTTKEPDVKIKFMWMRDKVNKVIEKIGKEQWVENLTKQGDVALANGYASLQRIP